MSFRPGDEVRFNPEQHYVYELVDADGVVFYVGRSNCPQWRLCNHMRSKSTINPAVTTRVRTTGSYMRIIHGPVSFSEAKVLENREIHAPGRQLKGSQSLSSSDDAASQKYSNFNILAGGPPAPPRGGPAQGGGCWTGLVGGVRTLGGS